MSKYESPVINIRRFSVNEEVIVASSTETEEPTQAVTGAGGGIVLPDDPFL